MVSHYSIDLQVTVIPRRAAMHQQRQGGRRLHANVLNSKLALQMFHEEQKYQRTPDGRYKFGETQQEKNIYYTTPMTAV